MVAAEGTFFTKKELLQTYFSKYRPPYLKDTAYHTSKILHSFNNTYFKRLILLAGFP